MNVGPRPARWSERLVDCSRRSHRLAAVYASEDVAEVRIGVEVRLGG